MAAAVNNNEQELRRLNAEMQYYEQTAQAMQQRLTMMNAALTDLSYANTTLESIEKENQDAELLVPIGGSSYINVKLANSDKVVVGMGSGVSVEKTVPEAKTIIKDRLTELEGAQNQMQQQLTQIVEHINQGRAKMESILADIRAGKQ